MAAEAADLHRLEHYSYALPEELIAQTPCERREESRLLVLERSSGRLEDHRFGDIHDYLRPGDVLVVNDTRVVPARLQGTKETGGKVEILVLDPYKDPVTAAREGYFCLLKASKPPREGSRIWLDGSVPLTVLSPVVDGKTHLMFPASEDLLDLLDKLGQTPLPPYIRPETRTAELDDRATYQTVYACRPGAVAAPTAGLHFSSSLLESLAHRGVERVAITLHVGYGTFAPVRSEDVRLHRMHSEYVRLEEQAARRIETARVEGRRIFAVGTTVVRALEFICDLHGEITPHTGLCNHYIYPGYEFKVVSSMITNFHLPQSSLLLLVSAFAGRDSILGAYRHAIRERYRFFSYGDAMLIL
jgi:S-adenosylmethionine:tRNA ribosyltransferase-isomerase